jgi:hypothetical protein
MPDGPLAHLQHMEYIPDGPLAHLQHMEYIPDGPLAHLQHMEYILCYRLFQRLLAGFPPPRPGFEPRYGHVGFVVVDKVALGQVFCEYSGFPCQFSFHRLLNIHHHLSSGAGRIGQLVADVPSGLSHPTPRNWKNSMLQHKNMLYVIRHKCAEGPSINTTEIRQDSSSNWHYTLKKGMMMAYIWCRNT